jgi:hypothetical protein
VAYFWLFGCDYSERYETARQLLLIVVVGEGVTEAVSGHSRLIRPILMFAAGQE